MIPLETLSEVVLADIQTNARLAKEDEEKFIDALYQISHREQIAEIERYRRQVSIARRRLTEIDVLMRSAFEKNAAGVIPDTMLSTLLRDYEQEKFN
jgi:hypothetical protein